MKVELQEIRQVFIDVKVEREQIYRRATHKTVKLVLDSEIRLLDTVLIFLGKLEKQGDTTMADLKLALSENKILLEDIQHRRSSSELETEIKQLADNLKPGQAMSINPERIKYGHFATKIYQMKKAGKLGEEFAPMKRGPQIFLARVKK